MNQTQFLQGIEKRVLHLILHVTVTDLKASLLFLSAEVL